MPLLEIKQRCKKRDEIQNKNHIFELVGIPERYVYVVLENPQYLRNDDTKDAISYKIMR